MSTDLDPRLSGRPGDQPAPQPREAFTPSSMGAYLDSPGGWALRLQHDGDRNAAANALVQDAQQAERWRREQAQILYDRDPSRYIGGLGEALARVGQPPGGGGAYLAGDSDELARVSRRVPGGALVVGAEPRDDRLRVGTELDAAGNVVDNPELVRPPWSRQA